MIRRHSFNSDWWGGPVGIVTDPAFFDLDETAQQAHLNGYQWVEYRHRYDTPPPVWSLTRAGFAQVDVQVRFRIGLTQVPITESLDAMDIRFAVEDGFDFEPQCLAAFQHERFACLPGVTAQRINQRYIRWAEQLIQQQPDWCLQVLRDGVPQGWFVSAKEQKTLNLTLAMLREDAKICGMHLYHKAMVAYAERGARIGHASYSVTNTAVMGIYANLGVRYLAPEGCWMWVNPQR